VGVHLVFPFAELVEEGSTKEDVFHTACAHGGFVASQTFPDQVSRG
jgi:hypothetical protein